MGSGALTLPKPCRELDLWLGRLLLLKVAPEAVGSWTGVAGVRGPEAHVGAVHARQAGVVMVMQEGSSVTYLFCGSCDGVASACSLTLPSPQPCSCSALASHFRMLRLSSIPDFLLPALEGSTLSEPLSFLATWSW